MDHDTRRLAGIAALRRVDAEREVAFRPRCQDCRFGPVRSGDRDRCEHFAHWQISPDRRLTIPVTTAQARAEDGLCGPDALLFKPYSRWRLVPRWLARQKPETAVIYAFWAFLAALMGVVAIVSALRGTG